MRLCWAPNVRLGPILYICLLIPPLDSVLRWVPHRKCTPEPHSVHLLTPTPIRQHSKLGSTSQMYARALFRTFAFFPLPAKAAKRLRSEPPKARRSSLFVTASCRIWLAVVPTNLNAGGCRLWPPAESVPAAIVRCRASRL